MFIQISSLSILAVLIGSTNALNRKSSYGSNASASWSEIPASKMKTEDGEYHRAHGVPRGECTKRLKPALLFIGQAYSGSTSLSAQMAIHPELSYGDRKEHQYFSRHVKDISETNIERYLEEFWVDCNTTVAYDATMEYLPMALGDHCQDPVKGLEFVKFVHRRMGPKLKLVVMVRDPVDILFHRQCTREGLSLWRQADRPYTLADPPNISKEPMKVSAALSQWLKVYPAKNQWLFLSSDEYYAMPQQVLDKIFAFAGVAPMKLDHVALKAQDGRRRCALKATPEERQAYWSVKDNLEDKKQLEEMTGQEFSWTTKSFASVSAGHTTALRILILIGNAFFWTMRRG